MPIYIVESHKDTLTHLGSVVRGTKAENYHHCVYLYRLELDVTEDDIRSDDKWTRHSTSYANANVRRSPTGNEDWWICIGPTKAKWPGTGERSNGKPCG